MMFKQVVFAADHGGFLLKENLTQYLTEHLEQEKMHWEDLGTFDETPVDYPDLIPPLVGAVYRGACGVLICGSGIGASIAANRYPKIRAALCHEGLSATLARRHNDANVLVLGGRLIGSQMALECFLRFIKTPFEGGRHARRIEKIENLVPPKKILKSKFEDAPAK